MPSDIYTGNGSAVDFTLTFEYTSQSFVEVRVDAALQVQGVDYTFFDPTTIRFTTPPPATAADNVILSRNTSTTLLVDWVDGGSITEDNLDLANQQILHIAEERLTETEVNALITASVLDPSITVSAFMQNVLAQLSESAAQTAFGASTIGALLFNAASSSVALQTALGLTSYERIGLQSNSTAAAHRAYHGITRNEENLVVNSDFQVNQLGTTFTTPNDNTYTSDQWVALQEANATATFTIAANGDTPNGGKHAMTVTQAIANNDWGIFQILESQKSIPLRSRQVHVSFAGSQTGNLTDFRFGLVSWAGTADAPTRDFVGTWNGTSTPTPVTDWTMVAPDTATEDEVTLDGTMTTYGATFTVPAGCNNLGVFIITRDVASSISDTAVLSEVQVSVGDEQPRYVSNSFQNEFEECQRFLSSTFQYGTSFADNAGFEGALGSMALEWGSSDYGVFVDWELPVQMLRTPTIAPYNPDSGTSGRFSTTGAVVRPAHSTNVGKNRVTFYQSDTTVPATHAMYFLHASADGRF